VKRNHQHAAAMTGSTRYRLRQCTYWHGHSGDAAITRPLTGTLLNNAFLPWTLISQIDTRRQHMPRYHSVARW